MEKDFLDFITEYEEIAFELTKKYSLASYNAAISGKTEDYELSGKLELELTKFYADKNKFEYLKKIKKSGLITDDILKRYLDTMYLEFAANQYDEDLLKEINEISNKLEQNFSTYRAKIDGKEFTDNEIEEILIHSTDNLKLQKAWESSKQIGKFVEEDVIKIVKLRNKAAKQMGYKNHFEKSLLLNEQDPNEIEKLFNELDELTKDEFAKVKNEIDVNLAIKLNIDKNQLRPWHYQERFFQHTPNIFNLNLDKYFDEKDLEKITADFFDSINLNIDDILKNSDLYEKPGKYQHAFCTDIDRSGDIRVLCNIKNNSRWMGTMLHEFGHAVYDKFVSDKLPWQLRNYAHIFATESIAMFFGRMVYNPLWLKTTLNLEDKDIMDISDRCKKYLKYDQLVFSRWCQVIFRFEKSMYENPDQDLNSLWKNLVEKYQMLKYPENRNEPDYAAKIHIALYPAYYHNYMLGELLASQLYYFISEKVLKLDNSETGFYGKKDLGEYLKNLFFGYGALYPWNELIKKATGENLTPKYYAKQFINL
ncbi:MAG TPA: M3 family metallopeptidase [Melioribacteraceae bacterium]|nr:M3 family metallopeptidase [Melioribacteraceae bacterium]